MSKFFYSLFILLLPVTVFAQADSTIKLPNYKGQVYHIKPSVDIPVVLGSAAFTLYNFAKASSKESSTEAQIKALDKNNINWFDRWAVHKYSKSADDLSYAPFYVAIPLPLLSLVDKKMRPDAVKISFLYAEAMTATGLLYSSATHFVNRYRPFTYEKESPLNLATDGTAKKSFFAGHVALVATSFFFMASVYDDYHPDSKIKWAFYSTAGVVTAATAYLRNKAGMHFPSDIVVGTAVGTLSGLLVPRLHKIKPGKTPHLSFLPIGGVGTGVTLKYRV